MFQTFQKKIQIVCLLFVFQFSVNTQLFSQTKTGNYCGSDQLLDLQLEKSEETKSKFESLNSQWRAYSSNKIAVKRANVTTLPVIFHFITTPNHHSPTVEALNKQKIQDILAVLNKIYSGQSVGNKSNSLNTNIQFCLAEVDAFGNAVGNTTSSYTYLTPALDNVAISTSQGLMATSVVNASGKFPSNKYINIYVVESIKAPVAGFASMPSSHGKPDDGIFIMAKYLTADPIDPSQTLEYNATVLAHEMGHYLGLLHTFGRCLDTPSLTNQPCSCDNNNCLVDGDMVCDTPPDFSVAYEANCTPPPNTATNSCPTDALSTVDDPNAPHPTSNVPDLINNYMDYGNWNCQYAFTKGQINRMNFSIDPTIGARNSLLNSTACNVQCVQTCQLTIKQPGSLTLTGTSISYDFVNNSCGANYNQLVWKATNLTTGAIIYTGPLSNISFTAIGNYRIELTATNNLTSSVCTQKVFTEIQVLPPAVCSSDHYLASGWNSTAWKRIKYENGWPRDDNGSFVFTGATMNTLAPTVPNNTDFSILTTTSGDANFSNISLPGELVGKKIIKVGNIIDATTIRPPGTANYVTYTFTPTVSNSKFRVYFLGMREKSSTGNTIDPRHFINKNITNSPSGFGIVCQYKFTDIDGTIRTIGATHDFQSAQLDININDCLSTGMNFPSTQQVQWVQSNSVADFEKMSDWGFKDLDFSEFVCAGATITITLFVRSDDGGSSLGYKNSYAYFGFGDCKSGEYANFDMESKNYYLGCSANADNQCVKYDLPLPYKYSNSMNGGNSFRYGSLLSKVTTLVSNDNQTWQNYPTSINTVPGTIQNNLYDLASIQLCKVPDDKTFKYFKITYSNLCQSKTVNVVLQQGFKHNVSPCNGNSGTFISTDMIFSPSENKMVSRDKFVQVCTTQELKLNDPCWSITGTDVVYQWQVFWGGWIDVPNTHPNAHTKNFIVGTQCAVSTQYPNYLTSYRRVAKYEDPYCGVPVDIPSDVFVVTSLKVTLKPPTISSNDVCATDIVDLEIKDITRQYYQGTDISLFDPILNQMIIANGSNNTYSFSTKINNILVPNLNGTNPFTGNFSQSVNNLTYPFRFDGTNVLTNGANTILVNANFNFLNCPTNLPFTQTITVKPSSIAGTINLSEISCKSIKLTGDDANIYVPISNRYVWQYSQTNNFSSVTQNLFANSNSVNFNYNLPLPTGLSYPFYVRRIALGTIDCNRPSFSNIVTIINPTMNVSVSIPATDVISTSPNPLTYTICGTTTPTATLVGGTSPYTYTWKIANVTTPISVTTTNLLTNSTTSPLSSGSYSLTVTDKYNCSISSAFILNKSTDFDIKQLDIYVCPKASENTINPSIVVLGTNNVIADLTGYTYSWRKDSDPTVIATTLNLSNMGVGTYTLIVKNKCFTHTKVIRVIEKSISISSSAMTCSGGSVTLTATPNYSPANYQWYITFVGGGETIINGATTATLTVSPTSPTIYRVRDNNCNTLKDYTVTPINFSVCITGGAQPLPNSLPYGVTPLSDVTKCGSISEDITICNTTNLTYSTLPTGSIINPTVSWKKNNVPITNTNNVGPGIYEVSITKDNCTQKKTVKLINSVDFTINVDPINVCKGKTIQLTMNPTIKSLTGNILSASDFTISWFSGAYALGDIKTPLTNLNVGPGLYTIRVSNGCISHVLPVNVIENSVSAITYTGNLCIGNLVTFSVLAPNFTPVYARWRYIDAQGVTQNPYGTANTAGNYTITIPISSLTTSISITFVDRNECQVIQTLSIRPIAAPVITGFINNYQENASYELSTNIYNFKSCQPFNSINITPVGQSGQSPFTYLWTKGGVTPLSSTNFVLNNVAAGTYTHTFKITDASTCSNTYQVKFENYPTLTSTIEPVNQPLCPSTTSIIHSKVDGIVDNSNPDFQYQWYFNNVLIPGAINPYLNLPLTGSTTILAGVYSYTIKSTKYPCDIEDKLPQIKITVKSLGDITPISVCANTPFKLSVGLNGISYSGNFIWTVGSFGGHSWGPSYSNNVINSITPVTVRVSDNTGCVLTKSTNVTPSSPAIQITGTSTSVINQSDNPVVLYTCPRTTTSILANSITPVGVTVSYNWTGTQPISGVTTNYSLTNVSANPNQLYTVNATDSKGCKSSKNVILLTDPGFTFEFIGNTTISSGSTNIFIEITKGGAFSPLTSVTELSRYSYSWKIRGHEVSTSNMASLTGGVYSVTVTGPCGPITKIIEIESVPIIFDDGDGWHPRNTQASLITNNNQPSIFPNPTSGILNFHLENEKINNFKIEVYDVLGKLILSQDMYDAKTDILKSKVDLTHLFLSKGVYSIRSTVDNEIFHDMITIE